MQELLSRKDQDLLVKLIESSGFCVSDNLRRAVLTEISLKPQDFRVETEEHPFLVNLTQHLVDTKNKEALRLMLSKIRLSSLYDRHSLRRLENKLNLSGYVPTQPAEKPAYFVDSNQAFRLMPLDVGTVWGLQRSRFIGLLMGVEQAELYKNLKNVEFVLRQAVEKSQTMDESAVVLPKREWIQLDIHEGTGVPFQKAHLIDAAFDLSPEVQTCLENNSFPDATLPGFYFEIEGEQLNSGLSERINFFCSVLLDQLFPDQSVAIVIHVIYPVEKFLSSVAGRTIDNLKNQLQSSFLKVPIELMQIKIDLSTVNHLATNFLSTMDEKDIITTLYHLNQREFYLLSDTLMDNWASRQNFDLLSIDFLKQILNCNQDFEMVGDFKLESLLLALIRNQQSLSSGSNSQKVQKILDELIPSSYIMQKVYNFYQNRNEQEEKFLNQNDPHQFTLAIRANVEFKRAIQHLQVAPVSNLPAPLCWLLSATVCSQNVIVEILQLDAKKRAVFGLCTPEEWHQIQKRKEKKDQVLDCRRKRNLAFASACF